MEETDRLTEALCVPAWRKKPPALDYAALVRRVLETLPEAGEADISTREGYALAKLKTLSKKPRRGCPDDRRVHEALWLCVGAVCFPKDERRRGARLREACEAALALTRGVPPREREAFRARLSEPADAMARLISRAITRKGE